MQKTTGRMVFKFTSDILVASKKDLIVIVGSLGEIYKSDLDKINNQLKIMGKSVEGLILI